MSTVYRACPFCGDAETVLYEARVLAFVECTNCGVMGPSATTPEEAGHRWNQRAGEEDEGA